MAEGESDYEKQREFNRDLGSYISSRKKRKISFRGLFSSGPKHTAELPPDVRAYGETGRKPKVEERKAEQGPKTVAEDSALESEYVKELSHAERGVLSRVFSFFKSKPRTEEQVENKIDEQGKIISREVQTSASVDKEFRDFEAEEMLGEKPSESRGGFFSGLAGFLGLRARVPDYENEVIGGSPDGMSETGVSQMTGQPKETQCIGVKDDMKDIAKISADILKKMDPQKLEEFKKTADFGKFKEILKKHNMIR